MYAKNKDSVMMRVTKTITRVTEVELMICGS